MRRDLWYALRRLRSNPCHTATVIGIFAVGSAAALTVFRVADAVLFRSLPYAGADRIAHVAVHLPAAPDQDLPYSDVGYRALEQRNRSFDAVAAYRTVGVNFTSGNIPERLLSARVTGSFFTLLGLRPQLGRGFSVGQEALKGAPVLMLSDAYWRRRFHADPAVIGATVRVDGAAATIIGVADPRAAFPSSAVDYWTLLDLDRNGTAPFELGLDVIARVRPGVSFDAGQADASRIVREVARENPGPHSAPNADLSDFRAVMRPIRDDIAGGIKPTLALLCAAVAFVLCLTCVNVAALELVRSSGRRPELAVRSALGADRINLVVGALLEGALLATCGGVFGLLLSAVSVSMIRSLVPAGVGTGVQNEWSPGVVMAALATIVICTVSSALFPLNAALSADLQSALRERSSSMPRRVQWIRRSLVAAQIAFACVLVNGAMLMFVTVQRAQKVNLGFVPEGVIIFQLSLPRERYPARAAVATVFRSLVSELRSLPNVQGAALASDIPLGGRYQETLIGVEGRPFKADGSDPRADVRVVSAGYFDALRVPVTAGRAFREGDDYLDGTPVVISAGLARLLFPEGGDPLGHRLRTGPFAPWSTIVGVVGDVRNRSLTAPARPELYYPFGAPRSPMGISRDMAIVLRTTGSAAGLQRAAEQVAQRANPDLPVYGVRQFDEVIRRSQDRETTTLRAMSGFAAVGLVLAIVGSYAMLMFTVVQRNRELALRHAIGATAGDLVRLIGWEMGRLLIAGMTAGVIGMMLLAHLLSRFLFGVGALDIGPTMITLAVIAVAGLGAALIPALTAAAVDPMVALRAD